MEIRKHAEQFVMQEFEKWNVWLQNAPEIDPPQLRCRDCEWAWIGGCRRLDRTILVPAHSPFNDDIDRSGLIICADFKPMKHLKAICDSWCGYDQWIELVLKDGAYCDAQAKAQYKHIVFRDPDVHPREVFCVPIKRWVYGKPIKAGILRATSVIKYKQFRFGARYCQKPQPIDGISVDAPDSIGGDPDI